MAKREIDPALAAAASFYERLTTPDSEDWNVIVDGDRVHLSAFQEERHKDGSVVVHGRYYVMRLVEFKKTVKQLPADHNIGCVTLSMPRDYKKSGAFLFCFLSKQAKRKDFSLTTMHGPADTAAAVSSMASWYEQHGTAVQ
jgi:hypothetical protein